MLTWYLVHEGKREGKKKLLAKYEQANINIGLVWELLTYYSSIYPLFSVVCL